MSAAAAELPAIRGVVRAAVISRDGIGVNERLHRAADCFVFERRDGDVRFIERRLLPPARGRVFRDYLSLASRIADCRWVIALGFNGEARRELQARGFLVQEARGPIEIVLRGLPADTL